MEVGTYTGNETLFVAVKRKVWEDFDQFELVLLPKEINLKNLLDYGAKRNKFENSENNFIAFYYFQICYSLCITFLTIFVTKKKTFLTDMLICVYY